MTDSILYTLDVK